MGTLALLGAAAFGVFLLSLLKRNSAVFAVIGELALVALIAVAVFPELTDLLQRCRELFDSAGISSEILKIMFKSFGILSVGSVVSDFCRDNSESAVAGIVDTSVKILAAACALPVFSAVLTAAVTLLG